MFTTLTRDQISAITGFDKGELFASEEQVMDYFTVANMQALGLGNIAQTEGVTEQASELDLLNMAWEVIDREWHCSFTAPPGGRVTVTCPRCHVKNSLAYVLNGPDDTAPILVAYDCFCVFDSTRVAKQVNELARRAYRDYKPNTQNA